MYFTYDGVVRFVQALVTSSGVKYTHGQDFEGVSYAYVGDTTGAIFEGANGVVQVVIPADVGGKPGATLEATSGTAGLLSAEAPPQAQLPPFYFQADTAPDNSEDGPSTTPKECAAPVPLEPGSGAPPVTPPSGGGTTNPPPGTQPAPTTEVRMTLARGAKLSAKKGNKSRSASFAIKTTAPVTGVLVTLKKGSKVLGSKKVARIDKQATVKLRLKGKLKKGAHALVISAKRADGTTYSVTLKVTVSK